MFFLYFWLVGQYEESTDDAYVSGNMLVVMPQTSGVVSAIFTDDVGLVEEGDVLVELDRTDAQLSLDLALSMLAQSVRDVLELFVRFEAIQAKLQGANTRWQQAFLDYEHRRALVGDYSVSLEEFERSETAFLSSAFYVREVEKELEEVGKQIAGTTVYTHPKVEYARSEVRMAFLALHRCSVRAACRGIVAQRHVQVGEFVSKDTPLLTIVPLDAVWVDANMREVSLEHIRIGQPVRLYADMYGGGTVFHGTVEGIYPGSGSVFSILPPQNATGNWIKIVQRVAVRICLKKEEILAHPLLLGLSMRVVIDTHDRTAPRLPTLSLGVPLYKTGVYEDELEGVESLIEAVIQANMEEG